METEKKIDKFLSTNAILGEEKKKTNLCSYIPKQ